MNIDLEDLLRQGIDRLPGEVPAALAHRAARKARRRHLVTGAGVAAAVATVTAVAVVIGVLSVAPTASKPAGRGVAQSARPAPSRHLRPLPSWPPGRITHATLVSRVEQAVLTSTSNIAYTRRYDYANRSMPTTSTWDYQNMHLWIQTSPHNAQLITYYPNRHTVKFVDYERRTWWVTNWPFNGLVRTDTNQCAGPADDSPQVGDPRWAAWLVSSLRCGAYTVSSHSGANGTPTLTIVNTPKDVEYQYGVRLHILVDATTYLPIADWQTGKYGYYDVIEWLRPTKARLAQLTLPVPPGFSHR
ncbi:MAG TPA: hypothetical protein VF070_12770 [Streptosporangiaceae bacterium]